MKNTLTHTFNYKKTIFEKKKEFEKYNMKSVNLERALGCLKIQEGQRS